MKKNVSIKWMMFKPLPTRSLAMLWAEQSEDIKIGAGMSGLLK